MFEISEYIAARGGSPFARWFDRLDGRSAAKNEPMALTRNVKETVRARMERDPGFRQALLEEGIERLLAGEVDLGKAVLRDYVNATIGFQELGDLTAKSPKSLMRMLGRDGNPQARHLFKIISCLQEREGLELKVHALR